MKKHNFNQTPILLENFDQVIRSSEIRSSDPLSVQEITFRQNDGLFANVCLQPLGQNVKLQYNFQFGFLQN